MADDSEDIDVTEVRSITVDFGVRATALRPAEVTAALGLQPTRTIEGLSDRDLTTGRAHPPFGIWGISFVNPRTSNAPEEHLVSVLDLLEPRKEVIQGYLAAPDHFVNLWLWIDTDMSTSGLGLSATTLRRASEFCHELSITVAACRDDLSDKRSEDPGESMAADSEEIVS